MKKRVFYFVFTSILIFTFLCSQLFNIVLHPQTASTYSGTRVKEISAVRGMIYDRNLIPLVNNKYTYTTCVKPTLKATELLKSNNSDKAILEKLKSGKESELRVTAEDIAKAVQRRSRVPVNVSGEQEAEILTLEERLTNRITGQNQAVSAVCSAIKRSCSGINRKNRPLGTFLFAGPTGVGKTELSKALSELLFGDKYALIRFDMSEFMEKHSVSALIGAPAGYAGYEDGGRLVEAVRKKPHSVVLFDEIEKAHPDVLNLLLQILDDGQVTAADGRKASLKSCIIIMTTNAGSRQAQSSGLGFTGKAEEQGEREINSTFRPEFLNRIDEIVHFHSLSEDNVREICRNMLSELQDRVREAGYSLEITPEAVEFIAHEGYSRKYGARNLSRTIIRLVENPISEEILNGCAKVIIFDRDRLERAAVRGGV